AREDRVRCHELGHDLFRHYEKYLFGLSTDIVADRPLRVTKSVIPALTFLLKLVPEHAGALEVRAYAYEVVGNARKAARDRERLLRVKPLPAAAPPPDETTFSQWFWNLMNADA